MSTGVGTQPRSALPERGRLVLPGRRMGWMDWAYLVIGLGVAVEAPLVKDGDLETVVTLGPWSGRVHGGDPLGYADAVAAMVWHRASRVQAGPVRRVRRRTTTQGWFVGGILTLAVGVLVWLAVASF